MPENNLPLNLPLIVCPKNVLDYFRKIVSENKELLGLEITIWQKGQLNTITLPNNADEFKPIHLQLLTRSKVRYGHDYKVRGGKDTLKPKLKMLMGKLDFLVKQNIVIGVVQATHIGGYPENNEQTPLPNGGHKMIILDQAGIRFGGYNLGPMFYPDKQKDKALPEDFQEIGNEMHEALLGYKKPNKCSENVCIDTTPVFNGSEPLKGKLDLDILTEIFEHETAQIIESANIGTKSELHLNNNNKIALVRILKAGIGAYSAGFDEKVLGKARLQGITNFFKRLADCQESKRDLEDLLANEEVNIQHLINTINLTKVEGKEEIIILCNKCKSDSNLSNEERKTISTFIGNLQNEIDRFISHIGMLELPYTEEVDQSNVKQLKELEEILKYLKINFGGAGQIDALSLPQSNFYKDESNKRKNNSKNGKKYIVVTTTCGNTSGRAGSGGGVYGMFLKNCVNFKDKLDALDHYNDDGYKETKQYKSKGAPELILQQEFNASSRLKNTQQYGSFTAATFVPVSALSGSEIENFNVQYASEVIGGNRVIYPTRILEEFKKLVGENPSILGATYKNIYSNQNEVLPKKPSDFTIRDLYAIARCGTLRSQVDRSTLASFEFLIKFTAVTALVTTNKNKQEILVIDTSGFEWQNNFYNSGSIFFYPDNPADAKLPNHYTDWQNKMYKLMSSRDRPTQPSSTNIVRGSIQGVQGTFDLNLVQEGIKNEFLMNLRFANEAAEAKGKPNEKLDFRYLAAGMGIFSEGLTGRKYKNKCELYKARLIGILDALEVLNDLPQDIRDQYISKIDIIRLPYSLDGIDKKDIENTFSPICKQIELLTQKMGIRFGGEDKIDAITEPAAQPQDENTKIISASTSCGSPATYVPGQGGGVYGQFSSKCKNFQKLNILAYPGIIQHQAQQPIKLPKNKKEEKDLVETSIIVPGENTHRQFQTQQPVEKPNKTIEQLRVDTDGDKLHVILPESIQSKPTKKLGKWSIASVGVSIITTITCIGCAIALQVFLYPDKNTTNTKLLTGFMAALGTICLLAAFAIIKNGKQQDCNTKINDVNVTSCNNDKGLERG
jgi:hypothetical protein